MKNHSVASCATLIILPKTDTYEIASRTMPLRLRNKSRVSPNLQSVTSRKIKQSSHHQRGLCLKKSIKQLRRSFNQILRNIHQRGRKWLWLKRGNTLSKLQQILEDNSFDRIRNKVKNIFQKRRPKGRK